MGASEFFQHPQTAAHKQYEALGAFYVEGKSAAEVAQQFGYTLSSFYSLSRDFKRKLKEPNPSQQFFLVSTPAHLLDAESAISGHGRYEFIVFSQKSQTDGAKKVGFLFSLRLREQKP